MNILIFNLIFTSLTKYLLHFYNFFIINILLFRISIIYNVYIINLLTIS